MINDYCRWECYCPYLCEVRCNDKKSVCGAKAEAEYYLSLAKNDEEKWKVVEDFHYNILRFRK